MPGPNPFPVRRGVTLLELLIVLTLMGVAAALVAPAFARRSASPASASATVIATARRDAIRRAEPLRVRLASDGAWVVTTTRDGAVVDSGHVRDALPDRELMVDALGGCLPVATRVTAPFDPLACDDAPHTDRLRASRP